MKLPFFLLFLFLTVLSACTKETTGPPDPLPVKLYVRGADISFLPEIEEYGLQFYYQNGQSGSLPDIIQESGCNTIRLRLWHTPSGSHSSLQEVSTFAKKLKSQGFSIFLTIHYSDTWADPGNQQKPAAWENLSFNLLCDSVYNYTKRVVKEIDPDIIEIGNEISNGFLWPEGSISNESNFTTLLRKGIHGARESAPGKKILIHCATLDVADWFYNILKNNNIDYDVLGISYYPFWTKIKPSEAIIQMDSLAVKFGKDLIIAETAYPFTLNWNDYTNNIIGEQGQLLPGYPATNEGQKLVMKEIKDALGKTNRGIGFCYWAPEWVAYKGPISSSGSSWENMALFDFNNKALPAMDIFKEN